MTEMKGEDDVTSLKMKLGQDVNSSTVLAAGLGMYAGMKVTVVL